MTPDQITNYWLTVGIVASLIFAGLGFALGWITGYRAALEDSTEEKEAA